MKVIIHNMKCICNKENNIDVNEKKYNYIFHFTEKLYQDAGVSRHQGWLQLRPHPSLKPLGLSQHCLWY